jgi:hypothetical protein
MMRNEQSGGAPVAVRAMLEESVARIDARTRSRLTQARHAALEALAEPRRFSWLSPMRAIPVTGALAAALVVALLMQFGYLPGHAPRSSDVAASSQPSLEVLDMLADDEGMSLMEDYDHSFYEWAAEQGESDDSGGKAQT